MAFVEHDRVPQQLNEDAYKTSLNRTEPLCLILNPRAGAGRAGTRIDDLKRAAARAFAQWEIQVTEGPGHATLLATQAVEAGFGIVAAVGGDGTCHEVAAGMVAGDRPLSNRVAFSTIPFGTGSDLMKSLQIPRRLNEALWILATGITLPTDMGRVTWLSGPEAESAPRQEYFINVAGFGANGDVVRRANGMDKRMGGRATFMLASLRTARAYPGGEVALSWAETRDGPTLEWQGPVFSCFVANGAYCGGGMWVGKGGTMQDGLLDVTVLPPSSLTRQLSQARRLYDGSIARMKGARRFSAAWLEARPVSGGPFPLDLDGEAREALPVRFELLPAALQVRGGWISNPVRGDRGRDYR